MPFNRVGRGAGRHPAAAGEEFAARCQAALDIVQRDLDVTGYSQYRMRTHLDLGWPPVVFAALPDGSCWTGAWGMTRQMDDVILLFTAASSVSGTLEEVHEIEWPVCAVHGSDASTRHLYGEERVEIIDGAVVWCGGARAQGMRLPR